MSQKAIIAVQVRENSNLNQGIDGRSEDKSYVRTGYLIFPMTKASALGLYVQ